MSVWTPYHHSGSLSMLHMRTPPVLAGPYFCSRYFTHCCSNAGLDGWYASLGELAIWFPLRRTPFPQSVLYGFTAFWAPYLATLKLQLVVSFGVQSISEMVPRVRAPVCRLAS